MSRCRAVWKKPSSSDVADEGVSGVTAVEA